MKVLLHTCCGPCLIHPLEVLLKCGFGVEAYFYNPNIYPEDEFLRREAACIELADLKNIKINLAQYNYEAFSKAVTNKERPRRCLNCWTLRLKNAAEFAKNNHFDSFTTTLLVSPYQDIEAIGNIGKEIAGVSGINFLYRDFRPGFRAAHEQARELGMYCQRYCGCSYSLEERAVQLSNRK